MYKYLSTTSDAQSPTCKQSSPSLLLLINIGLLIFIFNLFDWIIALQQRSKSISATNKMWPISGSFGICVSIVKHVSWRK